MNVLLILYRRLPVVVDGLDQRLYRLPGNVADFLNQDNVVSLHNLPQSTRETLYRIHDYLHI